MPRRLLAVLLAALVLSLLPGRLPAQAPVRSLRAGPAELAATAALTAEPARTLPHAVFAAPRDRRRQGVLLMIVGGAGIVTGILVDEPIVTIASSAVAGFGLYMYLDSGGQVGMRLPVP